MQLRISRERVRGILAGVAIATLVTSIALLGGRPSDLRQDAQKVRTSEEASPSAETAAEQAQPGLSQSQSPTKAAATKTGARSSSVAVGTNAPPLVGGIGRGISDTTIKIGFLIVENNQKLLSNYGVQGGGIGNTQDQVKAVVDDVNSRGILGRKIVPVYRTIDATATADQFPGICAAFTQDEKVFAVLSPWNSTPDFHACLAKSATLYMTDALEQEDQETFQQFKPYIVSGMMSSSRGAVTLARALQAQGFFGAGTRLGVIRTNNPTGLRVYEKYFKPTLASFGVTPVDEGTSSSTGASAVAQRFAEKQINRVAFITARGGPPLFFMSHAQSQGYFPRYGLASPDGPSFLAQAAPYTQLRGAVGAGWSPGLDVLDPEGPPYTAAENRCMDVHRKGGTNYPSRSEGGTPALMFCDLLWLFEEVGVKAGRTLNVSSFASALAELQASHQTTVTFGTRFGSIIFDGASQYRLLTFDDSPSCRCFRYSGGAQDLPR